ncbi:MAG: hypothetical protein AAGG46_01790, partial [Planctomycetota bacterium]
RALWGPLLRWVRGAGRDRQPFDAPRPLLAFYAAASTGYVLMVMTVVLWAVHRGLDAIGFRFAGDLIVAAAVVGLVVRIGASVAGSLRAPGFAPQWRPPLRLACATAAAGLVAFVVLGIELEQSLRSPCRLKSESASTVAAPAPGGLVRLVAYGSRVAEGDPIARIDDPQQEFALLEQREKAVALATQLDGLRTRAQRDPMLFSDMSLAETQLAEARRQTRTLERQRERRTLTASAAGVVGRPTERADRWGFDSFGGAETAAAWAGAPLDPVNDGCSVEPGDTLCVITGDAYHAVVMLRESDSALVTPGDRVRLSLDRASGGLLHGKVEEIALVSTDAAAGPGPPPSPDQRTLDTDATHRVLVRLDPLVGDAPLVVQHGAVGQARIVTGTETVGGRLVRWARQAFHFH